MSSGTTPSTPISEPASASTAAPAVAWARVGVGAGAVELPATRLGTAAGATTVVAGAGVAAGGKVCACVWGSGAGDWRSEGAVAHPATMNVSTNTGAKARLAVNPTVNTHPHGVKTYRFLSYDSTWSSAGI